MTESNSSKNNPDRRGNRKFRYGESSRQEETEYPLSHREEEMTPEEVEAYLAKQIELEGLTGGSGHTSESAQTTYGPDGKKYITKTTRIQTKSSSRGFASGGAESGGGDFEEEEGEGDAKGRSRQRSKEYSRGRLDEGIPELRTLRRWSLLSRWWMRSLGEGFYRFVTLDWGFEGGAGELANWRPTQQSLWHFSTLTGAASLLLAFLLFLQFRVNVKPSLEPESTASVSKPSEVDFSEEETIEPIDAKPVHLVQETQPDFSDFEKEEPRQLAMNEQTNDYRFEDEATIVPQPPAAEVTRIAETEPQETEFKPPVKVRDEGEVDVAPRSKAASSSTTLVESDAPKVQPKSAIDDDEWEAGRGSSEQSEVGDRSFKSVPLDEFVPDPVKSEQIRPEPKPVVTRVQEEKPVERRVPDPMPDPVPAPVVEQPVVRNEPPPVSRQRVAISRSGSWANDQAGAAIYSMTIRNLESAELGEVEIVETLPEGSRFLSASNQGEYDRGSHSVRWNITRLNGYGTSEVSVRVQPRIPSSAERTAARPKQTSNVQVSDRRGVMESRSWVVDHTPCPGMGEYPMAERAYPSGIIPGNYSSAEYSDNEYFFGW